MPDDEKKEEVTPEPKEPEKKPEETKREVEEPAWVKKLENLILSLKPETQEQTPGEKVSEVPMVPKVKDENQEKPKSKKNFWDWLM